MVFIANQLTDFCMSVTVTKYRLMHWIFSRTVAKWVMKRTEQCLLICLWCLSFSFVILYAIWYHLYNLKNVNNIHGGVILLAKLQASASSWFLHRYQNALTVSFLISHHISLLILVVTLNMYLTAECYSVFFNPFFGQCSHLFRRHIKDTLAWYSLADFK